MKYMYVQPFVVMYVMSCVCLRKLRSICYPFLVKKINQQPLHLPREILSYVHKKSLFISFIFYNYDMINKCTYRANIQSTRHFNSNKKLKLCLRKMYIKNSLKTETYWVQTWPFFSENVSNIWGISLKKKLLRIQKIPLI
jgi:hypothetical protein